jgi:hypothetical protein
MAGYTRQSTYTDGDIIQAADSNDEFDQLLAAFHNATGHKHDGTAAEGPVIGLIGDPGVVTPLNKIVVSDTNNRIGVFVDVSSSSVEQFRFQDGVIVPVTNNDIDLGTSSLKFKDGYFAGNLTVDGNITLGGDITLGDADTDSITLGAEVASHVIPDVDNTYDLGSSTKEWRNLYIDGTANIDSLVADTADINAGTIDNTVIGGTTAAAITGTTLKANTNLALASGATVTAILDEDAMTSNSATALATQQSIKAYVDAQVTAQDLDFQADTGGALSIDLDSETMTFTGGTGIDTSGSLNTVTIAIDSTVATLAGTQTLTNKTLTAPIISTISNTGTLTLPTSTDTLVGRATTDTLTNKTLTSAVLNGTISGTSIKDEDDMVSDSASHLATQQSIKAYVDAQVTAQDLDLTTDSGTIAIDLDSETLTVAGTVNEIETSATGNIVTIGLPDSVTIKQLTLNPDTNVGKVLALEVQQGDVFKFGSTELYQDRTSGVHYIVNPTAASILTVGGDSTIISDSTRNKTISRFDFSGGNGTSYIGYYDSTTGYSAKLTTSNTGVTINGSATATTFSGDLNGTINSATTGTTQTAGTNNTTIATTAFATTVAVDEATALAIALG